MRVRVFDSAASKYFVSEVYGILGRGIFQRCIVRCPDGLLRAMPLLDSAIKPLINSIDDDYPAGWTHIPRGKYASYHGDPAFTAAQRQMLLDGAALDPSTLARQPLCYRKPGWSYVESQAEIDCLTEMLCGFHDGALSRLHYNSGTFVHGDGIMRMGRKHELTLILEFHIDAPIELVFEGVIDFHLRPAPDNYTDDVTCGDLWLEDETLWLALDSTRKHPRDHSHTWVHAYGLRWRVRTQLDALLETLEIRSDSDVLDPAVSCLAGHIADEPDLIGRILRLDPSNTTSAESRARVIAAQSDAVLEHYASGVLDWLKDLNWPGSMRLFQRLTALRKGRIDTAIAECIGFAENLRDEEWIDSLRLLQNERSKI